MTDITFKNTFFWIQLEFNTSLQDVSNLEQNWEWIKSEVEDYIKFIKERQKRG